MIDLPKTSPDGDLPSEQMDEALDPEVSPTFTHLDMPADIETESVRRHNDVPDKAAAHALQAQKTVEEAKAKAVAKLREQEAEDRARVVALKLGGTEGGAGADGEVRFPPIVALSGKLTDGVQRKPLNRTYSAKSMRAPSRSEQRLAKRGFSRNVSTTPKSTTPKSRSGVALNTDTGLSPGVEGIATVMSGF